MSGGAAGAGAGTARFEELAAFPDHSAELAALVGQDLGLPNLSPLSPHAVNVPMIRHWVEAMGDENPVYLSDEAAREAGYDRLIAPPTMLQAWIMRGLRASMVLEEARAAGTTQGSGPNDVMMGLLDDEGLTSVVATNCEQQYGRPLVVGDRVLVRSVIESISDPKRTGLGTGRFVTTSDGLRRGARRRRAGGRAAVTRAGAGALRRRRAGGDAALPHPQVPAARPPGVAARRGRRARARRSPRTTPSGSKVPAPTGC